MLWLKNKLSEFYCFGFVYYILYKIEDIINEETPSIIVFKNADRLLNNEIFTDKIINLLDRFKLKNCVVAFCFDAEDLIYITLNPSILPIK